jgi:hypothetical protein
LVEASADRLTVVAMSSAARPSRWQTSHISFQKLILVALKMLWQHFTISAAAGLSKVRTSPPKLWVRLQSRSTVDRLLAAITVIQGNRKSSSAVAARRNSGFEASANPWLTCLPEACSSSGWTTCSQVPGGTVDRTTTVWKAAASRRASPTALVPPRNADRS